jgi:hypothetical protein
MEDGCTVSLCMCSATAWRGLDVCRIARLLLIFPETGSLGGVIGYGLGVIEFH